MVFQRSGYADHGTITRYYQHVHDGDSPCDACKQARRERAAELPTAEERKAKHRQTMEIRRKALIRLSHEFQDRYREIYEEERIALQERDIFKMFTEIHEERKNDAPSTEP